MSVTTKDKLEFGLAMGQHSKATLHDIQRIMRHASTHSRLAVDQCNREWTDKDQTKRDRVRAAIIKICKTFDATPVFSNDPRGCTVKIQVPDGFTNDWGKEGICVPTA